jgi:hypothetical protein
MLTQNLQNKMHPKIKSLKRANLNNQKNNKKAQPLSEIFNSSIEIQILDSIMPGGEYWELFSDSGGDCKKDCPSYCQSGKGPYNKLCTTNWHSAKLNIRTLSVLKHVFTYFEYYNRKDIDSRKRPISLSIGKIRDKIQNLIEMQITSEGGIESYAVKKIRSNQHKFRANLISYWGGCSITGVPDVNLLVASHIKPWSKSNRSEKLDPYNLDFLFDNGYISFTSTGSLLISSTQQHVRNVFPINHKMHLLKLDHKHCKYLSYHRKYWGFVK